MFSLLTNVTNLTILTLHEAKLHQVCYYMTYQKTLRGVFSLVTKKSYQKKNTAFVVLFGAHASLFSDCFSSLFVVHDKFRAHPAYSKKLVKVTLTMRKWFSRPFHLPTHLADLMVLMEPTELDSTIYSLEQKSI